MGTYGFLINKIPIIISNIIIGTFFCTIFIMKYIYTINININNINNI
jgi:hypothetical protein